MRFNYRSDFDEWAIQNKYEPDDWLDQTTLLEKSYSRIIQFYIANDNGTYAEIHAYQSEVDGLFDISVEKEGLSRVVEKVIVNKVSYK